MTSRVPPVGPVTGVGGGAITPAVTRASAEDRRGQERRSADRRAKKESASRELVPVGKPVHHDPAGPAASKATAGAKMTEAQAAAAAFAAQMLGQGGQRNGIKGGPPVMDAARSAYLGAEYTGEKERRPPVGTTKRTDI